MMTYIYSLSDILPNCYEVLFRVLLMLLRVMLRLLMTTTTVRIQRGIYCHRRYTKDGRIPRWPVSHYGLSLIRTSDAPRCGNTVISDLYALIQETSGSSFPIAASAAPRESTHLNPSAPFYSNEGLDINSNEQEVVEALRDTETKTRTICQYHVVSFSYSFS